MSFHNPYHFVPAESIREEDRIAFDAPELTHDRYLPERLSGRAICRLVTETPMFIGSHRTPDGDEKHPAEVEHYRLDGLPAIPATTLRGMISSLVETATNSALRVLEDETYSFRRKMNEALSAIGMIVEENGRPRLRPLTLPTIERQDDRNGGRRIELPEEYRPLYQQQDRPNLRLYFADEYDAGKRGIGNYHTKFQTYTNTAPEFYYLKRKGVCVWEEGAKGQRLVEENLQKNRAVYIGQQKADDEAMPLTPEEFAEECKNLSDAGREQYARGVLRIMRVTGRDLNERFKRNDRGQEQEKKGGRRFEVFIPYPEGVETWPTFEIDPQAIERFRALADNRTGRDEDNNALPEVNKLLPYHPVNTPRNKPGQNARRFRLKTGDLVFFRPSRNGNLIKEISLSAIWRDRVEDKTTFKAHTTRAFFREIDQDLLPFNDERTCVTIAESMFGFVNESRRAEGDDGKMRAFAGRVFPSAARLYGVRDEHNRAAWANNLREQSLNDPQLPATTLKILSSPKPPSPAMYFKMENGAGGYIAKSSLNAKDHRPQGRKYYLHRWREDGDTWTTRHPSEHLKQKVRIAPVKSGAVFYFHIDFENLSAKEVGALLYALRPTNDFRHKIGMGKPLGLGTVRIEPVALLGINRGERYTAQGLFAPRYSQIWIANDANAYGWTTHAPGAASNELPQPYADEIVSQSDSFASAPADLYTAFRLNQMLPQIRHALELIGDPTKLQAAVHTPTAQEQSANAEEKTFTWFVNNDNDESVNRQRGTTNKITPRRQWLKPLSDPANAEKIEPLEENRVISERRD